ncbi:hypothetical protein CO229_02600 [Mycoplasmopsis bovirhinis]|uniref:hypothetical protein n=1 Tax=Mycoplasmopsis bovirhinis TaxID=29553 RepID=UPI000C05B628|nr:hypothetical protein [Mycoplasmopsis bovirhinis]ATO30989.1 hypothetical protein CO229_02600 [Mycoplasmopsis bovirhinis]
MEITTKWQEKNLKTNKNKIFQLINSFDELLNRWSKTIANEFKSVDFNEKSILIINGLDYRDNNIMSVVKGSGYWINKLNIVNKKISIEYKFKEIKIYDDRYATVAPALTGVSTIHFVVIDKLQSLNSYNFEFS